MVQLDNWTAGYETNNTASDLTKKTETIQATTIKNNDLWGYHHGMFGHWFGSKVRLLEDIAKQQNWAVQNMRWSRKRRRYIYILKSTYILSTTAERSYFKLECGLNFWLAEETEMLLFVSKRAFVNYMWGEIFST